MTIVYEDDQVIVVDKDAGMAVHPGRRHDGDTLVDRLGGDVWLVHRIDKDTSGIMIVAKTREALAALTRQLDDRSLTRIYNVIVWGSPIDNEGVVRANIGRVSKRSRRMGVYPYGSEMGKPAVTNWRVLERLGAAAVVECRLETGRMHQIRAHMSHIGHPLVGDRLYGGMMLGSLCPRQALHACSLTFNHPATGQPMTFDAPWPDDIRSLTAALYSAGTKALPTAPW